MGAFPSTLLDHRDLVERALREHVDACNKENLALYRMMRYQLGWVDKDGLDQASTPPDRLYGSLCVEAARSVNPSAEAGLAAAAVELLVQSMLVHEEMQLAEGHSEQHPAVWWIWGPAQSINVGDGLYALARLAVFRLQRDGLSAEQVLSAVAGLDAAALRYYEGHYLDLTYQERVDISERQYVQMAEAKRGALFSGAVALGAQIAGAGDERVQAFRRFGERLGLAAHIKEEIDLIWRGGEGVGRLLSKSKPLPMVHVLEKGSIAQKRALGEVYFKRVMEYSDLEAVRQVLDDAGARAYAEQKASEAADEALVTLGAMAVPDDARERWGRIVGELTGQA